MWGPGSPAARSLPAPGERPSRKKRADRLVALTGNCLSFSVWAQPEDAPLLKQDTPIRKTEAGRKLSWIVQVEGISTPMP